MNNLVPYITKLNDTWDMIANRAYANPMTISELMDANPGVPIMPILPAGIKLMVPVLTDTFVETNDANLPPWKRSQ